MHTGWIALMAFMFADYVDALVPLGHLGATLFAMATVVALVALNLRDVRLGFLTQAGLVGLVAAGFLSVVAAALWLKFAGRLPIGPALDPATAPGIGPLSKAFIYIFLAYGGWSDAATLSAEIRDGRLGMFVAIAGSLFVLMAIYLALNWALMAGLGLDGLSHSAAPAADLLARAFGKGGQALIVAVVGISAVASINSTLIVGARTTYAAGRDLPFRSGLGDWDRKRGVPARAVIAEGAVAIALIALGAVSAGGGFNTMVDYMTPVYWFFLMLSMGATMILRRRFPAVRRPVRTPLYPVLPACFLIISAYMFYASLVDLGFGALVGAGVMALGAVLVAAVVGPFRPAAGRA
jgi:amino acid transporter